MNVLSRVKRILLRMKRFKMENIGIKTELGEVYGYYYNSDDENELVTFCENGVSWVGNIGPVSIQYNDIFDIKFNDKKNSDHLVFTMKNGDIIYFPVKGRDGKFVDSMEMMRFFDRVISDLDRFPAVPSECPDNTSE